MKFPPTKTLSIFQNIFETNKRELETARNRVRQRKTEREIKTEVTREKQCKRENEKEKRTKQWQMVREMANVGKERERI